ncbi:hypothetical protein L0Y46_05125 [bacterium]|nr:hypothetical protein [bacterium]
METSTRENASPQTQKEIRWQALEYAHYEKTPDWYWGLGFLTFALAGFAIYLDNILFAVMICIGAFTVAMFASRKPDMVEYALTDRGIKVGNRLYPYQTLRHFWVHEKEGSDERKLFLESMKPLTPLITIPVNDDVRTEQVRGFLLPFMQEDEIVPPSSHAIMELFRF